MFSFFVDIGNRYRTIRNGFKVFFILTGKDIGFIVFFDEVIMGQGNSFTGWLFTCCCVRFKYVAVFINEMLVNRTCYFFINISDDNIIIWCINGICGCTISYCNVCTKECCFFKVSLCLCLFKSINVTIFC